MSTSKGDKVFLIGERVYLRPLEEDDLKGPYKVWINDKEVTRYLDAGTFPVSDKNLQEYFEKNTKNTNSVIFAIVEKETKQHIGNARIYKIDWIHRKACRGIMIGEKSSWGKGYGLEVINLISKYAFEYLNLNKLRSSTYSNNKGVAKVNKRAGYKIEGKAREEYFREGEYRDATHWAFLRSEYMENKLKTEKNEK